jgi:hypothetical protein
MAPRLKKKKEKKAIYHGIWEAKFAIPWGPMFKIY